MHKQLNPELFGENKLATTTSNAPMTIVEPAFLNVDRQIFDLKNQMHNLADQIHKLSAQLSESVKNTNLKMERIQQQMHRFEQSHNGLAQETAHKVNHLNQKIGDRKNIDQKVQDMIDRHTNIIKTFEVRMNHLQKLLAEKESQVIAAQAALNETKMEIARLKRI